jgi:hypothetical protein
MDAFDQRTADNPIPPIVATFNDVTLTPKQRNEYINEFNMLLSKQSRNQSSLLGIEDKNVSFRNVGWAPRDLNFVQGRKIRRDEVICAYGQTPALYDETANRATADGALYKWAKYELDPDASMFAQKLTEQLLPMYDGGERLFFAFDRITADDVKMDIEVQTSDRQNKIRTINEIRIARGLEPDPDPRADDLFAEVTAPQFTPLASQETTNEEAPPKAKTETSSLDQEDLEAGGELFDGGSVHKDLAGVMLRYP